MIVLVAAVLVGVLFGFNKATSLKDAKTLTVKLNTYAYNTLLDEVEAECEKVFEDLDLSYVQHSEMSGDSCELFYVFDAAETKLEDAASALKTAFDNNEKLEGSSFEVGTASEEVVASIAKGYVLRGVIAGVVFAVLAFVYVALRYRLDMGIHTAVCALGAMVVTTALLLLTRIPVTSACAYVIAIAGFFTVVANLFTMNNIRAKKDENADAEELVSSSVAVKEISIGAILCAGALVLIALAAIIAAGGINNVVWFALAAILAVGVSAFFGLVYAPALYVPLKVWADKVEAEKETGYKGAEKTSTKVKKIFTKKEEKIEVVEETPVEETAEIVEETSVEEVTEVAEETPVEETTEVVEESPVEETTEVAEEAPVEETAEVAEEAPVEEAEEKQE